MTVTAQGNCKTHSVTIYISHIIRQLLALFLRIELDKIPPNLHNGGMFKLGHDLISILCTVPAVNFHYHLDVAVAVAVIVCCLGSMNNASQTEMILLLLEEIISDETDIDTSCHRWPQTRILARSRNYSTSSVSSILLSLLLGFNLK